jgi:hypothetical protein
MIMKRIFGKVEEYEYNGQTIFASRLGYRNNG